MIDYGFSQTNIDKNTGIRYGVIPVRELSDHFWETMQNEAIDMDYQEALGEIRDNVKAALKSALSDYAIQSDLDQIAQNVVDELEFEYESTGDNVRYSYQSEGLEFFTTSDGDVFVTKSPYFTYCNFCSPCAPGAGYLTSEGSEIAYCLGPEWFSEKAPYVIHKIS
jgi:hypothetical protein